MRRYEWTAELFGEQLSVEAKWLDDGVVVEVYGGCRTHVGAVCHAVGGIKRQTIRLDSHKEHLITEKWAPRLSVMWDTPVTMLCGIHYDGPTREMLDQIVRLAESLLQELSVWTPEQEM